MSSDVLGAVTRTARDRRLAGRAVYSVVLPLVTWRPEDPGSVVQDVVSQAIHLIEDEGWTLDRVSTFASTSSHLSDGRVLLVFRGAVRSS